MLQPPVPARLVELRDRIDNVCSQARALLSDSRGPDNAPGLARTRWQLTKALSDYHHFVLGEVCGSNCERDPHHRTLKARMRSDCDALNRQMHEYAKRWSSGDNAARWAEYRPAALQLLTTVHDQIARNDRVLTELILARSPQQLSQAHVLNASNDLQSRPRPKSAT